MTDRPLILRSAAGLGLAALVVYAWMAYPSVPGGDAGELIAAVYAGGVPHPPGYPLYALAAKPFTWIPLGSVAWRLNLASAVFAAGAVALLAWAIGTFTNRWWAGLLAGGLFAFAPGPWLYAVTAEVFALNALIVAGVLALLVHVNDTGRVRPVFAAAALAGLGLANHQTSGPCTAVMVAAMIWRTRRSWTILQLGGLVLTGLAGLGLYAWLPLAAAGDPAVSWGDPTTWDGFLTHVLRREYGTFQLGADPVSVSMGLVEQLATYARDLWDATLGLGALLALVGIYRGLADRAARVVVLGITLALAAFLVAFHSLANLPLGQPLFHGVVERFWLQADLLASALAGIGLAWALAGRARVGAATAVLVVLVQFGIHASQANHHDDWRVHDYGAAMLAAAPPGALVLTRGDLIFNSLRYLQSVDGERADLRIADQELLTWPWATPAARRQMPDVTFPGEVYRPGQPGAYSLRELVDANISTRPVMLCGGTKPGDESLEPAYRRWPIGLCDRLLPAGQPMTAEAWLAASEAALPQIRLDPGREPPASAWEHVVWEDWWEARHRRAVHLLTLAMEQGDRPDWLRQAAGWLEQLVADHPAPAPPFYYKNLGIAHARLIPVDPASRAKAVDAWQHYLAVAPANDPQLAAIQQAIRELAQ